MDQGLVLRIVMTIVIAAGFAETIQVEPLPSGLMRTKTEIDTVRAMWTLVITFPQDPPHDADLLLGALGDARKELLAWRIPLRYRQAKEFWLSRVEELVMELKEGPGGPRQGSYGSNRWVGEQEGRPEGPPTPLVGPFLSPQSLRQKPEAEDDLPEPSKSDPIPEGYPTLTPGLRRRPDHPRTRQVWARVPRPAPGANGTKQTSPAPVQARNRQLSLGRKRRGLIPILGDIGKSLFGLATEEDVAKLRDALETNRRYTDAVHHDQGKLLSVINATRAETVRNRKTLEELTGLSKALRDQFVRLRETAMSRTSHDEEFKVVNRRITHMAIQVRRVWYRRQQFEAARRDWRQAL